ncbi:terminase small subunit [Aneurinibacillus thermoaerophilus]|jgi:phage terminase small subunit|uniref:terminase small subunit n=1 Tax=Aneurinibacillus thermoaerophilus TaxID=143495 RepID=UPI002E1F677F|nr:terminase small subunit [Aneurinibacillus thermoaerophilus]MED0737880.1 terminase small subunit [Aneurinibacillus thermoaerophilus]MED0766039.1 terminase small subunit [Aneurinibacillus thermoaerophilus]
MAKLNAKQRRFVEEYLIDLNATQAAIRAGYSVKRASEIGYQLLQKTTVSEAIAVEMARRSKRTEITQDMIVQQLAKIAFADLKEYVEWNEEGIQLKPSDGVDGTVLQSISEVNLPKGGTKTEIKMNDKLKALELLGRHLGMFKDNVNVNATVGVQIIDDIGSDGDAD